MRAILFCLLFMSSFVAAADLMQPADTERYVIMRYHGGQEPYFDLWDNERMRETTSQSLASAGYKVRSLGRCGVAIQNHQVRYVASCHQLMKRYGPNGEIVYIRHKF